MKPIAVVILNWNGAKLLQEYLPSVCRYTPEELADVIVADNGSIDNSLDVLREEFPSVRVIAFDQNHGFAQGYNMAIDSLAEYRYIVLLNSDVEVSEGWLQPLYEYAEQNPDVAALQPKIRAYRDKEYFEYAGACGGYLDCNGFPYCRGRIFDAVERDNGQYDTVCEVFWASGAALMVRTEVYRALGGLDASFFAHMEEIDLCWRMRLDGHRVMVVPQGVVYHYGGASLDSSSPRKLYLNYRNNLLMMYKNLPVRLRSWRIFRRMCYDGISAVKYLVSGQFSFVKAVWDAHCDYRKMKKQYHTLPHVNCLDNLPEGKVNIILDYFLRGKKHYSEVVKRCGYINGHKWVDLGLSVKWATCNVGASSPSSGGNYYAWGEISTKSTYTGGNSTTYREIYGDISGDERYDAARANWGGSWRMPTKAECEELVNNCTWKWTTQGGVNGYRVTSKKNGNSIFLPAAGYRDGSSLDYAGVFGDYWSSTPYGCYSEDASYLGFYSSNLHVVWNYRYCGRTVRPVCD